MVSRYLWALLAISVTAVNAGKATWYYPADPQNGDDHDSVGSCGTHIANSDMVAALGYVTSSKVFVFFAHALVARALTTIGCSTVVQVVTQV